MRQPDYRTLPTERLEEMVRDPRLPPEMKGPVQDELIRRFMAQSAPGAPAPAAGPPPGVPQGPPPGPPPVQPRRPPAQPRSAPPRQMPVPPPVSPPPAPARRSSKGSSAIGWVLVGVILTIVGVVAAVAVALDSGSGGGGNDIDYATTCDVGGGFWCPVGSGVRVGSACYCNNQGVTYQGVAR